MCHPELKLMELAICLVSVGNLCQGSLKPRLRRVVQLAMDRCA